MGDKTGIGWTESTWSPVTGCTRVYPGCGGPGEHGGCYAEILSAGKLAKSPKYVGVAEKVDGKARWTGLVRTHPAALAEPLKWRKPRRVFVCSMSDLFHKDVPDEFIAAVFGIAAATPRHSYQFLTKRAERLPRWFEWTEEGRKVFDWVLEHPAMCGEFLNRHDWKWPLPNVALGVSVEDQQRADERIPQLLRTPATVRWVSCEPLLGPVDLSADDACRGTGVGISWLVVGGESGPRHRSMDLAWLESIVAQCKSAGTAIYVKQDSGPRPGKQGRIPDELWALKQYPET